jgi:transglutaminase-like putative cysteine protease
MTENGFLSPGVFVDSNSATMVAFARAATTAAQDQTDAVLRLYQTVRDAIRYDPYVDFSLPASFQASAVVSAGRGFCIGKASVFAACARVLGVPARLGFADVRNHLTSPRLLALMQTDVFRWHGYTELYLAGKWVKATPAFNASLCERVGVPPLDFDGRADSLFHAFDRAGRRHMEYVLDRGSFADVPFERITADFKVYYPQLMGAPQSDGDFASEVTAGDESDVKDGQS